MLIIAHIRDNFFAKRYCNRYLQYPLTRIVGNATLRSEMRAFGMPQRHGVSLKLFPRKRERSIRPDEREVKHIVVCSTRQRAVLL